MNPYLSLILPAYNEARSIRRTLELTRHFLHQRGWSYELLISADGTDGTREAAAEVAASDPRVIVLGEPQRGGKGRGIRLAVARASGYIIGFADADYKTPIEDLDKLLPWLATYDLVIGFSRRPRFEHRNGSPLVSPGRIQGLCPGYAPADWTVGHP